MNGYNDNKPSLFAGSVRGHTQVSVWTWQDLASSLEYKFFLFKRKDTTRKR